MNKILFSIFILMNLNSYSNEFVFQDTKNPKDYFTSSKPFLKRLMILIPENCFEIKICKSSLMKSLFQLVEIKDLAKSNLIIVYEGNWISRTKFINEIEEKIFINKKSSKIRSMQVYNSAAQRFSKFLNKKESLPSVLLLKQNGSFEDFGYIDTLNNGRINFFKEL